MVPRHVMETKQIPIHIKLISKQMRGLWVLTLADWAAVSRPQDWIEAGAWLALHRHTSNQAPLQWTMPLTPLGVTSSGFKVGRGPTGKEGGRNLNGTGLRRPI